MCSTKSSFIYYICPVQKSLNITDDMPEFVNWNFNFIYGDEKIVHQGLFYNWGSFSKTEISKILWYCRLEIMFAFWKKKLLYLTYSYKRAKVSFSIQSFSFPVIIKSFFLIWHYKNLAYLLFLVVQLKNCYEFYNDSS